MPKKLSFNDRIDRAVAHGHVTYSKACGTRKRLRRNSTPGAGQRQKDIAYAIAAINGSMTTIRSLVGQLPWKEHAPSKAERLAEISALLQAERKKLKKMAR